MKHIMMVLLLCTSHSLWAQEMWGGSTGNYSGAPGILLNPSTLAGAPYKYHINLLTTDNFVYNTYFYFPKENKVVPHSLTGEFSNTSVQYDNVHTSPQDGSLRTLALGPSFFVNNGRSGWGVHMAYRNQLSALHMPYQVIKLLSEHYDYAPYFNQDFHSNPFSIQLLSWGEIGFTYSRVLFSNEKHWMSWGATINGLGGFDAASLDVKQLDYQFPDSATGIFHTFDASLAYAFGQNEAFSPGSLFKVRGTGLGTTFGVTYVHNRNEAGYGCNTSTGRKYLYRAGVSLIDIGAIRFTKDAQVTRLYSSSNITWNNIDTASFHSFTSLSDMLSNEINGSITTENKPLTMWLPAAMCLQFDYSITPSVYAGATWINRIGLSSVQASRNNQLNLSVRYEKKKFETGAGMTFTEYRDASLGFYIRYGFFLLGTDRLAEWMGMSDVKSFDLYFGIRFNFCEFSLFGKKTRCTAYGNLD